jgi:hypothetical protein
MRRARPGDRRSLIAHQSLEMTFALETDEDGNAELVLICEPGKPPRK